MTSIAGNYLNRKRKQQEVVVEDTEQIKRDLSRPLPRLTLQLILIIVFTIGVFAWGMEGTDARPDTFAEGIPNIIDFVERLAFVEFEFEPDSERAHVLFPSSSDFETHDPVIVPVGFRLGDVRMFIDVQIPFVASRTPTVLTSADRLRDIDPATEEQLAELEDGQVVQIMYRTEDRRFHFERDSLEGEIEEVPFIRGEDQYLHLERGNNDIYTMDNGTRFVDEFAIDQSEQLVAGRYVINRGEIFLGWPVLIAFIVETVQMALIGTAGAIIFSIPFGLLAARNVSPSPVIYQITRFFLNANRAIPELVYALIMVSAVGLGPFAGVLALIIGSIGSMGKLYAESIEAIEPQQVAAVRATGASSLQVFNYSVIPQAFPMMASYSLLLFEGNVRAATILGIVGAGGVGFIIQKYIQLFQYHKLMGAVVVIIIVVTLIDRISDYIRKRII